MRITVKAGDLQAEVTLSKQQAQKLHSDLWKIVRTVSLDTERGVKGEMPVRYGRARASWGHWTPGDLRPGAKGASAADAHWKEDERNLTIEQGSNVEYVPALNDGHSSQAPAGFIDALEKNAQRILDADIDRLLSRYF